MNKRKSLQDEREMMNNVGVNELSDDELEGVGGGDFLYYDPTLNSWCATTSKKEKSRYYTSGSKDDVIRYMKQINAEYEEVNYDQISKGKR